jgi:aryl-alcohol dehydrogenase-like predicted oxidoreductase
LSLTWAGAVAQVSVSNVATRWVVDQPAVGGAIVGARLGLPGREHAQENLRVFGLKLDDEDRARIAAVQGRSKDLLAAIGDCGAEYRG